jgi:Domain of unknown function (DUF4062)
MPDTDTRAAGAVPYRPTVYLSSTYKDLIEYRKAGAQILRKMNKIVVSMEDYTASDERPPDKCLADVAACDIYVGLFAFRYGFIPTQGDPENLSITELEWRKAKDLGKPCLIFIADEAGWPMTSSDFFLISPTTNGIAMNDRAVGGEDLVIVLGRQVTRRHRRAPGPAASAS